MPRRHKSKRHNNQKVQQARDEARNSKKFEAAATVKEDPPSSSSSVVRGNPQSSSATDTTSISQVSSRVSTTTITSLGALHTRSEDTEDEADSYTTEILCPDHSCSDSLAEEVMVLEQFLLHKYRVKQPILKEDMLEIVNQEYHNQFTEILKKASENIEVLFAVDLMEVDSTRQSYELVSKLKLPNNGRVRAGRGFPKTGLVMSVLGMIFLNGNRATEEDITAFLNMMRVYPGRRHFFYGEPWKLITKDMVRLNYLECRQVPDSDPPRYEFLWGPKAFSETSKMKILEHLAKLNDTVPWAFSPHYEEALKEEEESAKPRWAARAGTRTFSRKGLMAKSPAFPTPVMSEWFRLIPRKRNMTLY